MGQREEPQMDQINQMGKMAARGCWDAAAFQNPI